jgi:Fur family transcriptional regulator, ferric uptake regulator
MEATQTRLNLRSAGLKITAQREQTLDVLESANRPLSVEEIRDRMTLGVPGIPTIYRNLEHFVREGLAETLVGPDQVMRFIRCHSHRHHHHLQCETCGRMAEVEECGLEACFDAMQRAASGFRITRHHLQLFGICADCQ